MIRPILLLALLASSTATAAEAPAVKGADVALLKSVRSIAGEVERIRGEAFERPPIAVRAPDMMREIAAEIRALNALPRERLQARGRAWVDLGLGGEQSPERLFKLLANDIQGIGFDPSENRLLVAPDRLSPVDFLPEAGPESSSTILMMTGVRRDEPVASHLLMHVRQFERAGGDSMSETTDGLLARSAWAEGEANLVAIRLLFDGMGLADEVLAYSLDPRDVLEGALVPGSLAGLSGTAGAMVRFVYLDGFAEAVRWYRSGGWEALDAAMTVSRTTRDVLHPERAGVPPVSFVRPEKPLLPGLALVDEDSLGEQSIAVLISTLTGKDNLGLIAADGWTGDVVYRWEVQDGDLPRHGVTEWKTSWQSAEHATDFDYAFARSLTARFPGVPLVERGAGVRELRADGRVFRVELSGEVVRVVIIPEALIPAPAAEPSGTSG